MLTFADFAVTQIQYLTIPEARTLGDADSYYGKLWSAALDLVEQSAGFQRLYWGRSLEKPENVQLHIGRWTNQAMRSQSIHGIVRLGRVY